MRPVVQTVSENYAALLEEVRQLLARFLEGHASVRWVNPRSPGMVFLGPTGYWTELTQEGRRAQSQLRERASFLRALTRTLLAELPDGAWKDVDEALSEIEKVIEQDAVWAKTTDEEAAVVNKHLDFLLERIADLYDGSDGVAILMPDTSAVIHNPALEDWEFVETKRFTILLTPTVLGELDDLKVAPRAEVRERAESAIRRIEGYMSRGNPHEGIPLRRDRSTLRLLASEPRRDHVLPWLDLSVKDDRHIASVIDAMRQHPRTPVVLVARDINMKNKAIYARLPHLEPPDPPASSEAAGPAPAPGASA